MRRASAGATRKREEKRFITAVLKRLDDDFAGGRLRGPTELHDCTMAAIAECMPLSVARHPYRVGHLVQIVIARAIGPSVRLMTEGATEGGARQLVDDRTERTGFEERLRERWGQALDTLTLFRLWCLDAGMILQERYGSATKGDWVYAALVRLHARACLVAAEVLALLGGGFASGAHARWRTAHEIAVVGAFIAEHGQDTAERYLLHEAIESNRALPDYQRYATRLGYEQITTEELELVRRTKDALLLRFGSEYAKPYGWASKALGKVDPKFSDIQASTSFDHQRPYYRMASYPTHAGPKSIVFDLGRADHEVMLAGPSNAGLADPGHAVAISLLQVTLTFLAREPDMGDLVRMTFLQGACDAVGRTFIQAHQQLVADDERERRSEAQAHKTRAETGVSRVASGSKRD
jgi:hypothetical protein